jgi:transcriptional regulator with XRE-family HTH domain
MAQRTQIVAELKQLLKERGISYAHVAKKLALSEATIKRLFSTQEFSLQRLDEICELAGVELTHVIERMHERTAPTIQLSVVQEQEIIADQKLFLLAWLLLNRWRFADIVTHYAFTEREALRHLIKLDRLKIIELQPGNKVRLLVSRHFTWRAGGPVQNYIHQKILSEFFASRFTDAREEFYFHGGVVSEAAMTQLKKTLQNAARECVAIMDRDRHLSIAQRGGAAFVLALRPWQYSGFGKLMRKAGVR